MEQNALVMACYNAVVGGHLENTDQRWDIATADMLRSSMLRHEMISPDISAMQIYNALAPAFDIGTCETDKSPYSFKTPDAQDIRQAGIDPKLWEEGEKKMARTYVKMEVIYDTLGNMKPTVLHWVNGRKFPIDTVTDIRQASNLKNNATGGSGTRFTCMISGQERYLWFMEGMWFVETRD